jgi:hypothetical protein
MKGLKHITKRSGNDAKTCLMNCWLDFEREFSGLDWKYMKDHNNGGELFCDIGVTHHPRHEEPLVGLWRLDSLEASFGAAGYKQGELHNLNTLSLYGGMQAEMGLKRCERTHIAFRSSYNLAYEVTRSLDNGRDLFKSKEAYDLHSNYLWDTNRIMDIYQHEASAKSFGVRDEFRVGGQTLDTLSSVLDDLVCLNTLHCQNASLTICLTHQIEDMMDSQPILWIQSSVWFNFLAKRVQVLRETQRHLHSKNPANYGIMTGLLTFMLQSVLFTPTMVSSFVNEALALLWYRQNVDRFGMFFLHSLDLNKEKCLPEMLIEDDLDVLRTLGVTLKKKSRPRMPSPDNDVEVFPLGRAPSWPTIQKSVRESPWILMRAWSWSPQLANLERAACKLFILFTVHIWATLHENWRTECDAICPTTVEEALKYWTLQEIHHQIKSVTFVACNAGLAGIPDTKKMQSFADRRELYFPPSDDGLSSHWNILATAPGYINEYHIICDKRSVDDINQLNDDLAELLSNCHCLPNSRRDGNGGKRGRDVVWDIKSERVVILTNPSFYKLQRVGEGGQKRNMRRAPTHTAKKQLLITLLEHTGVSTRTAKAAVNWSKSIAKRRSGKAKNRRVPPPPRKRKETDSEDGDNEEIFGDEDSSMGDLGGKIGGTDSEEDEYSEGSGSDGGSLDDEDASDYSE